jgi:adenine-specific DNA-methyltransferase
MRWRKLSLNFYSNCPLTEKIRRYQRIDSIPKSGYKVADYYGLLVDLDKATEFCKEVRRTDSVRVAYIVTNDDRRFQIIIKRLPDSVEPVRLYESYLKNFEITGGE